MKQRIAAALVAVLAAAAVASDAVAQEEPRAEGPLSATVEIRIWQDVSNALKVYISARPGGGNWATLGTVRMPLDSGISSNGQFRYGDTSVGVPVRSATALVELRVWQSVHDARNIYISARPEGGRWGTVLLPLDSGISSNGRFRYGDIVFPVTLRSVRIPDAGLRAAVEEQLGKAPGTPIFPSEMATLRTLDVFNRGIRSLEGLQYATELTSLDAGRDANNNRISDLSPLAGLRNLTSLRIGWNEVSDLSPLADLEALWSLYAPNNRISDLSPLSGLTELCCLSIWGNNVSDISPLSKLTELRLLRATRNDIADVSPLSGLAKLVEVNVEANPLDHASIDSHIPALLARGVDVEFDEVIFTVAEGPQIYNDNVFVLPISESLTITKELRLEDYVAQFHQEFEDQFDFLMLLSNLRFSEDGNSSYSGIYTRLGVTERLQGTLHFPYSRALRSGPSLHELMHRWANFLVPSSRRTHWGFSSANGQLGGFDIDNLVHHGGGQYSAGRFGSVSNGGNSVPYSPIERYLAGFIGPEDVPDLWVAEDGEWTRDEDGNWLDAEDGDPMFTASRVRIYTIEDIIAEHGPRVPDHTQAQHDFRAAAILLIDEDHPATRAILERVSSDVSWFSHPGTDEEHLYNFFEATGGRGTIAMDDLSRFLRSRP